VNRTALRSVAAMACALAACAPAVPPSAIAKIPTAPAPAPAATDAVPPPPKHVFRETPDAPFRASAPPLADALPHGMPPVHTFHLANGVPVYLLEQHASGFLRIQFLLQAREAPLGANAMAARGLWYGTSSLPMAQFRAATDGEMAAPGFSCDWGWFRATMTTTSDRAASSIARLAEVVLRPAFPASEIISSIRAAADENAPLDTAPPSIAARVLHAALYGLPQPEDELSELRSGDLGALSRNEVANAYAAALDSSPAALLVLGDTNEKTVRPLLEKSFGAWHGKKRPSSAKTTRLTLATSSPRLVVVDHPGSRTWVTFGGEGPAYPSADWAPLQVLRGLLNGSKGRAATLVHDPSLFTSEPALERSAKPSAPRVAFNGEVPTARTGEALAAMDRVLRAMKTADVTVDELERERRRLVTSEMASSSTLAGENDVVAGLVIQQLPPDDVPKRPARFLAVGADDVRRVGARYLDPDRMKIVVVGDWAKLRDQLLNLGWGPVELRDERGALLPSRGVP